jgi:serine/threonine protein kinase
VYALSATLYALLRGAPPRWERDHPPGLLTLIEMFAQPVPDLPNVPAALCAILRQGMANDPAERPTARALEELLASVDLDGPAQEEQSTVDVSTVDPPTVTVPKQGFFNNLLDKLFP